MTQNISSRQTDFFSNSFVIEPNSSSSKKQSYQYIFLSQIIDQKCDFDQLIEVLEHDCFNMTNKLTEHLSCLSIYRVDEIMVKTNPLLALIVMMIKPEESNDTLREQAADIYQSLHPEDERFNVIYAEYYTPHVLIGHLLIVSGLWKTSDRENQHFYDEKIAGLLRCTIANDAEQYPILSKLIDPNYGFSLLIEKIEYDRLYGTNNLVDYLINHQKLFEVEPTKNDDPLLFLLYMILKPEKSNNSLREFAAMTYIATYPEDALFNMNFAYSNSPHSLIAHLLIQFGFWRSSDSKNTNFYEEQMLGIDQGTIAFDKGDHLTQAELLQIQSKEGKDCLNPILNFLEKKEDGYVFLRSYTTPKMQIIRV